MSNIEEIDENEFLDLAKDYFLVNEKNHIERVGIIDNENKGITVSDRLVQLGIIEKKVKIIKKPIIYPNKRIIVKISSIDEVEYKSLLTSCSAKMSAKYLKKHKNRPNINMKKQKINFYDIEFYKKYGDKILESFRDDFKNIDFHHIEMVNKHLDKLGYIQLDNIINETKNLE